MAQAIHENGAGHLYSADAVEHWARVTWQLMPANLQSLTTCSLDGPDFQVFHLGTTDAVCDPIDIEQGFKPGFCMVVDGRVENTRFLRSRFKRRYSVTHHWPQERWETTIFRLHE